MASSEGRSNMLTVSTASSSAAGAAAAPAEREVISIPATPTNGTQGDWTPTIGTPGNWTPTNGTPRNWTPKNGTPGHWSPLSSGMHTPAAGAAPSAAMKVSVPHTPGSTRPPSSRPSPRVPKSPAAFLKSPRILFSPIGTPMRKAFTNMKTYLEDLGHITKLNPQDAWLPITASRNGNAYYSAFHNVTAGIGFQGLLLPVALTFLGWTWGMAAVIVAFVWQLYTLWMLIQLHEAVPGKRYSRYMDLAEEAFGPKWAPWLTMFPIVNLSAGTATGLIAIGGGALQLFFKTVCQDCTGRSLTTVEWYLVFAVLCAILSQLPNLNSIAGVSLFGAISAIAYTTMVWGLSVSTSRPADISYDIVGPGYPIGTVFSVLNALGIVSFAFRGHNLVLEIQGTMPSTLKHPATFPMWRGTKIAYAIVAMCYLPLTVGGYWAYGNKMLPAGILYSMYGLHPEIHRGLMAATFLLVVLNSLSSFQIYSMPMFDIFEQGYTTKHNKPCPKLNRHGFRLFFVFFNFFISVALPFIASFAGLLGALSTIPVTFCYPCFMWLKIKKPLKFSFSWYLNWTLGILAGFCIFAFAAGGIWSVVHSGVKFNFFKP